MIVFCPTNFREQCRDRNRRNAGSQRSHLNTCGWLCVKCSIYLKDVDVISCLVDISTSGTRYISCDNSKSIACGVYTSCFHSNISLTTSLFMLTHTHNIIRSYQHIIIISFLLLGCFAKILTDRKATKSYQTLDTRR